MQEIKELSEGGRNFRVGRDVQKNDACKQVLHGICIRAVAGQSEQCSAGTGEGSRIGRR